jgi:hypothetical protein
MAAAQATLLEVLTPAAYALLASATGAAGRLRARDRRLRPARAHGRMGSKGCVVMRRAVREYRDYLTRSTTT